MENPEGDERPGVGGVMGMAQGGGQSLGAGSVVDVVVGDGTVMGQVLQSIAQYEGMRQAQQSAVAPIPESLGGGFGQRTDAEVRVWQAFEASRERHLRREQERSRAALSGFISREQMLDKIFTEIELQNWGWVKRPDGGWTSDRRPVMVSPPTPPAEASAAEIERLRGWLRALQYRSPESVMAALSGDPAPEMRW